MVTRYKMTGACSVCGKPVKRDTGRSRQNRTCSRECLSIFASQNTKRRRRTKPQGLTVYQAEDYLELLELAERARPDERADILREARKMLQGLVPNPFSD